MVLYYIRVCLVVFCFCLFKLRQSQNSMLVMPNKFKYVWQGLVQFSVILVCICVFKAFVRSQYLNFGHLMRRTTDSVPVLS